MKYAKSLTYGGELIQAIDCTYNDFKRLAPLCPNCSNPVYLRAGGDRASKKGKEYTIAQHWSHFAGKSPEEVAGCELRVNGCSDADREKIQRVARGQRERWIRRWFWRVWEANVLSQYEETCSANAIKDDHERKHLALTNPNYQFVECHAGLTKGPGYWFDPVYLKDFKSLESSLTELTERDFIDAERPQLELIPESDRDGYELWSGQTLEEANKKLATSYAEIASRQNACIAFQASRFLLATKLVGACFYSIFIGDFWIARESYHDTRIGTPEEEAERGWEDRVSKIKATELMDKLLEIPWASEFAKLEAEVTQAKT